MSPAINPVSTTLPCYGPSNGRFHPCSVVPGGLVSMSPCSAFGDHRRVRSVKCGSMAASLVCKASSAGYRRNPDFSRQNRHGFSKGRNRQNEERDSYENFEESELLSSKNGSLSLSSTRQATATPGSKEKKIVELFKRAQAHLRERAAIKEEKKPESLQGHSKESENVNSLLKLLKKHSNEKNRRKSNSDNSSDFTLNQTEQSITFDEHKSTNFLGSSSIARDEVQEHVASSLNRPASNFHRKSPIPRVIYEPIVSSEDTANSELHVNSSGKRKGDQVQTRPQPNPQPEVEPEPEPESEAEPEAALDLPNGYVLDEMLEGESSVADEVTNDKDGDKGMNEDRNFSSLKLAELKIIAKSQGVKGFSKLKKGELVELLRWRSI